MYVCVYVCVVCVQGGRVGCGGDVCEVMYECKDYKNDRQCLMLS